MPEKSGPFKANLLRISCPKACAVHPSHEGKTVPSCLSFTVKMLTLRGAGVARWIL